MKLVERIMAGVTACALTMCILTACGGSGGGSGASGNIDYKNSKLASYNKQYGSGVGTIKSVYRKSDEPEFYDTMFLITSGFSFYFEDSDTNGYRSIDVSDGENVYELEYIDPNGDDFFNHTKEEKIAVLEGSASDWNETLSELFPTQIAVKSITAGKNTLNGKEYYTEEVTYVNEDNDTQTATTTYYYSGDTLKYRSWLDYDEEEGTTVTWIEEIIQLSTSVDTSKLKVPSGFTIMTEEEFEEYLSTK